MTQSTEQEPSVYTQAITFLTPANIKKAMFSEAILAKTTGLPKPTVRHQAEVIKKELEMPTLTDDDVIFIRNDPSIISLISNYRKQNAVQIYIFVEPNNFVSLIAKNMGEFPLILLRIPIDEKNCFAKQTAACYEFPIDNITSRVGKDLKASSYSISYKRDTESNVSFSLYMYGADNKVLSDTTISSITIYAPSHLSLLLEDNMIIATGSAETSDSTMLTFLQMSIIMLSKSADGTVFSITRTSNTESEFVIERNQFKFVLADNRKRASNIIATKNDANIWLFPEERQTYKLENFNSLFKAGFSKPTHNMNKVYYIFTKFTKWYLFIKMITSLNIDDSSDTSSFGKLFSSNSQIIECYACNPLQ